MIFTCRLNHAVILSLGLLLICAPAQADSPQVKKAEIIKSGNGSFRIDVTLRHADSGWEHYADKWDVIAPDGSVLATRILYHPHVHEQPFTRSLSGLKLGADIRFVRIRPHDKQHGYGELSAQIPVPGHWTPAKCRPEKNSDWLKGK